MSAVSDGTSRAHCVPMAWACDKTATQATAPDLTSSMRRLVSWAKRRR